MLTDTPLITKEKRWCRETFGSVRSVFTEYRHSPHARPRIFWCRREDSRYYWAKPGRIRTDFRLSILSSFSLAIDTVVTPWIVLKPIAIPHNCHSFYGHQTCRHINSPPISLDVSHRSPRTFRYYSKSVRRERQAGCGAPHL